PAPLAEVVAAALGLREEAGEPETPPPADRLAGFVRGKRLLRGLGHWGRLVGACAEWVQRLRETGRGLTVLATSREVLGVAGEAVWPVPPLAVPDADDELDAGSALAAPAGDGVRPGGREGQTP